MASIRRMMKKEKRRILEEMQNCHPSREEYGVMLENFNGLGGEVRSTTTDNGTVRKTERHAVSPCKNGFDWNRLIDSVLGIASSSAAAVVVIAYLESRGVDLKSQGPRLIKL